jgi:ATP-binding cassette, subfamily B, beta-glucan exporter
VISRTATTLTILAILMLGTWFYLHGQTTVGEIVMFMSYATLLIGKLDLAQRTNSGSNCYDRKHRKERAM